MSLDKKYKKLTSEEVDNAVKIVARLFVGNTLYAYLLSDGSGVVYVHRDDYDRVLKEFGVDIKDKSQIKRISFKTPEGFNPACPEMGSYGSYSFIPTDNSKEDFAQYFGGRHALGFSFRTAKMNAHKLEMFLTNLCKQKFEKQISSDTTNRRIEAIKDYKWIEIVDTDLGEVVGYCSVEGAKGVRAVEKQGYVAITSNCCLTKSDFEKLGLPKSNIVSSAEAEPKIVNAKIGLIRRYAEIIYDSYLYIAIFYQGLSGAVSFTRVIKLSDLGLTDDSITVTKENIKSVLERFEKERLSGNKWFINKGKSFIPKEAQSRVSSSNNLSGEEIMKKLNDCKWLEIFDTDLGTVVGYISLEGGEVAKARIHSKNFVTLPSFNLTKQDFVKLGLPESNIVGCVDAKPTCREMRGKYVRLYNDVMYNNEYYDCRFHQGLNGLSSMMVTGSLSSIGLVDQTCEVTNDTLQAFENERLKGNKLFENNGQSFLPRRGISSRPQSSNKQKGGLGKFTDAFKIK